MLPAAAQQEAERTEQNVRLFMREQETIIRYILKAKEKQPGATTNMYVPKRLEFIQWIKDEA